MCQGNDSRLLRTVRCLPTQDVCLVLHTCLVAEKYGQALTAVRSRRFFSLMHPFHVLYSIPASHCFSEGNNGHAECENGLLVGRCNVVPLHEIHAWSYIRVHTDGSLSRVFCTVRSDQHRAGEDLLLLFLSCVVSLSRRITMAWTS